MVRGRPGGKVVGGGTICEVDDLHPRTYLTSSMSLRRLVLGQGDSSCLLGQGNW